MRRHIVFPRINRILDRLDMASPVGKMLGQVIEGLVRGRLEYQVVWDDLRSPATAINLQGPAGPPTADSDGSLLFAHTSTNQVAVIQQMPHAWVEGSEIRPHVHWSKSTDAAGGVVWEMRYRLIGGHKLATAWSDWIVGTLVGAPDSTQQHRIASFGPIDMTGETLSCIVSYQVRRNHAAVADDYGASARLWEFDTHYQIDKSGSDGEFTVSEL